MFSRKFSSSIRRKKRMIISSIILLVVCLSTGYAAFTTNLGINGTLEVSKYDHTLYGVLEKAAKKGIYAKEYTGEHQDSMSGAGTEKIYHWYAPLGTAGDTLATEILDKNNVIFAGQCWQMIRTTDTGGVKMIYNGEPENGQCLNTRGNHVGYSSRTTQSMSPTYYYGTSYTYDKTNNVFSLDGTVTTGTIQTGQYTCKQTTSTGTCSTLYLVDTLSNGTSYYVLPLNSSSHYSQFGKLQFNQSDTSPAAVGYMNNKVYSYNYMMLYTGYKMFYDYSLSLSYYYSDTYDYNNTSPYKYTLTNAYQITSETDYESLVGKYTLMNTSGNYSSDLIYYIAAVNNSTMYCIVIASGNNLNDYDYDYTYGDSYTDNGDGTYTINNPTSIKKKDYYNYYNTINKKYMCMNTSSNTCNDLKYIYYTSKLSLDYMSINNKYKYAKNYTYTDGMYHLSSDQVSFWDVYENSDNVEELNTHHYTCWNVSGECTNIYYIYAKSGHLYYIVISDGKGVNDAINEMLYNNDVNTNNSVIKTGVDAWYIKELKNYENYLDDTIFCNNRQQVISSSYINGWNPEGGKLSNNMRFAGRNNLECTNNTDKFSVSNNVAKLKYKIGLLTRKEIDILNNETISKTKQNYWLMTPEVFETAASKVSSKNEYLTDTYVYESLGVRPAISLKPGTEYASGTGSMADPYVVDVPMATLTINYKTTDGTVLHEPYVETMPVGADYSITSPTLIGYEPVEPVVSGTMTANGRTTTVIYTGVYG
ncbi:MAG: MucBP domain-containing protein [Bacilli bacterium]|nr:MucBP domain-containing protein [Bacilli bacterium]